MKRTATVFLLSLSLLATACQGYRAGTYHDWRYTFDGEQRSIGCIDVAIDSTTDSEAVGPVAQVTFANRCDAPAIVDLSGLRASGRLVDGNEVGLAAYDPDHEIRPLPLEARRVARENIEFQRDDGIDTEPGTIVQMCVDLSGIDAERPSQQPVTVCMAVGAAGVIGGNA